MEMLTQEQIQCLERKDLILLSTKAFEGKKGLVTVKTNRGYYLLDTRYGLYVCSNCRFLLNQEMAVHDELCSACRWEINAKKMLEQAKELGII